jgi:2-iminobutanoate/2-iminopropanoate deaminase
MKSGRWWKTPLKTIKTGNHMKPVTTDKAPAAVGPYSQAIETGKTLFCSGQIGLVPGTGKMAGDDIQSQTRQLLSNLAAVLDAAAFRPGNIVKTTVFLTDMNDFAVFNKIYADFFGPHKPARSTVQVVSLPLGALVEIDCIAVRE